MSLILDALKKLEREKAARRDGTVNVADEILRPHRPQPGNKRTLLLTIAAVGAGLAAIAAFALMGGSGDLRRSSAPVPAVSPAAVPPAAMPQAAPAVIVPPAGPPQKTGEPAMKRSRMEIEDIEGSPSVKSTEPRASQPPAVSRPRPADEAVQRRSDMSENSSEGSVPPLKVSGTVWQKERDARRAVVNGIVATEGSVVNGAKVVEIYPNRVTFSRGGKTFDVPIESR